MPSSDLKKQLENPVFTTEEGRRLWEEISVLKHPFDRSLSSIFPDISGCYDNLLPISAPANWPDSLLPIEEFKENRKGLFQGAEILTDFHSSGTSSAKKSVSSFSKDGLTLYKATSLLTFFSMLKNFFPQPEGVKGISLIPPQIVWPTSSLARMVSWIAECSEVTYTTVENLSNVIAEEKGPVWIFATALHLEKCGPCPLPRGSIVIETGGTKSVSENLNRSLLYQNISEKFSIAQSSIVSEYGMCEISSQAYDFVGSFEGERKFRFPSWVDARVTQGLGVMETEEKGSLVIYDRARIDYPWPIRTEDLAYIDENEGFSLLGRAPLSPLKGCSLLAKDILDDGCSEKSITSISAGVNTGGCTDVLKVVRDFLSNQTAVGLLADDLGAVAPAKSAIDDLISSLPTTESWKRALDISEAYVRISEGVSRWLVILPENHPIVGIYPLTLGAASGLSLGVRLPKKYENKTSFLYRFVELLSHRGIKIYNSSFRVSSDMPFDAVMCYGEDNTVKQIAESSSLPTRGFGSSLGVSIISFSEFDNFSSELIKDAFSLGQTGCMSSRLLVITSEEELSEAEKTGVSVTLQNAFRSFWKSSLSFETRVGIDLDEYKYLKLGAFIPTRPDLDSPLFAFLGARNFDELISRRAFVLPIVIMKADSIKSMITPSFKTITVSPELQNRPELFNELKADQCITNLGEANSPKWTGRHEGRAVFGLDK